MSDTPDYADQPGPQTAYEDAYEPDAAEKRAAAEREADKRALDRKNFLTALLSRPEARTWLWELLVEWNTFNTQFGDSTAGEAAGQISFYWRGMHDAGWRLWTQLDDAAPDLASMMRREHKG